MEITLDWHGDQFNINLHSVAGADPFLTVRGCRVKDGTNGAFISYPVNKNEKTGKWWNHVQGGEKFNAAVLKMAQQNQPKKPSHDAAKARQLPKQGSGFDDFEDAPF